MSCLLDTSVLVRLVSAGDAQHALGVQAVKKLHRLGEVLHLTPQTLIEFRSVVTRPVANNGLGLTGAVAEMLTEKLERELPLLPDSPDIFPAWKTLVRTYGITGKQVHDARLVAVCQVHGIGRLLTFNTGHFARFASATPGVEILAPQTV
jgi:predicted nucleic acid-binding protein